MKQLVKKLGLIALLLFSLRVLDRIPLPLMAEFVAAGIVVALIFVLYYYVVRRVLSRNFSYSAFEIYVLVLLVVPFVAAFQAYETFGQPLMYGVLSQRSIWIASSALVVLASIRHGVFAHKELEKVVVGMAWVLLVTYVLVIVAVDPKSYGAVESMVAHEGTEYKFKFPLSLIVFGFLYYSCKAIRSRTKLNLMFSLPFLFFLVLENQGRSLLLALMIAISYFVYRWTSTSRFVVLLAKSTAMVTVGFGLVYLFHGDIIDRWTERYSDAFTVVLAGTLTRDASANARIHETNAVLPYVRRNWLLGNGGLSNQWEDGYKNKFGYFYTSDIGLIGVVFVYGVAGAALLYLQFLFALRYAKTHEDVRYSPFLDASSVFLLFLFLHSFVTGSVAFDPSPSLFFIALLYSSSRLADAKTKSRWNASQLAGSGEWHQSKAY